MTYDVPFFSNDSVNQATTEAIQDLQTQINVIMNNPDAAGAINSINEFAQYTKDQDAAMSQMRADISSKAPLDSPQFTNGATIQNNLSLTSTSANKDKSYFSMNRLGSSQIGAYSSTLGYAGTASAESSHSEGNFCEATMPYAHAEGDRTHAYNKAAHAEGEGTTSSGEGSHAEGVGCIAYQRAAHAEGLHTRAFYSQHTSGKFNTYHDGPKGEADTTGTIFMVGCGTADSVRLNAFRVDANGKSYFAQAISTSGADFAEYFEWADGNPNNEDRRGRFVALRNDKIEFATDMTDCIGITSATGAYIGNAADEDWHRKYLADVYGERLTQEIEIPASLDKDGNIVEEAYIATQFIINPEYNPEDVYISRANRKEWAIVGMLGQIVLDDDGTCEVGGRVVPGINGVGTASSDNTGYRVMKRIDATHVKVVVK